MKTPTKLLAIAALALATEACATSMGDRQMKTYSDNKKIDALSEQIPSTSTVISHYKKVEELLELARKQCLIATKLIAAGEMLGTAAGASTVDYPAQNMPVDTSLRACNTLTSLAVSEAKKLSDQSEDSEELASASTEEFENER